MIRDFDDLEVYKLAIELAEMIYDLTSDFPREEKYGVIINLIGKKGDKN